MYDRPTIDEVTLVDSDRVHSERESCEDSDKPTRLATEVSFSHSRVAIPVMRTSGDRDRQVSNGLG